MKMYMPFTELTLPENAYDQQLHCHLLETVDALAGEIPPMEAFEAEAAVQAARECYGYGGMVYMPYGWLIRRGYGRSCGRRDPAESLRR